MRTLIVGLSVCLAVGVTPATGSAADPLSRKDLDHRIENIVHDAIAMGAPIFNQGDQSGCLRIYQGTLMAVAPLLDHRPQLMELAKSKLEAAKSMSVSKAAFALRETLDEIQKQVSASSKPLWDRLGGEAAVSAVVHDFVLAAAPDPKVDFFRGGKFKLDGAGVAHLERLLVELVSAVSGGPLKYSGRDMKSSHAGMKITDAQFDALAGHLVATLKKFKVPEAETNELVGIVASTRKDIVEVGKKPLWTRLGGEPAVRAVVKEFLVNAAKDPKANIDRNGNYPLTPERVARVEQLVVEFVSSVTGGELKYSGRDMRNSHVGMKITTAEFNAAAGHLVAALKKFNVPQAEIDELVGLVAGTAKDIVEKP